MRIPILCYRPLEMSGRDYARNPLVALAADLRHLDRRGFQVVPLRSLVDAWLDNRGAELEGPLVALTTDIAADFAFRDLPHPTLGEQRSVLHVLRDFAAEAPGRQPRLHVTSFDVGSADAREQLDRTCMIGGGWWTDAWWPEAVASGLMHLGSNSWDYNHESLPANLALASPRGTFASIATQRLADLEIRQAVEHLRARAANPGDALFAWPYGEANPYLAHHYLPAEAPAMGLEAAFGMRPGYFEPGVSRWEVPRFVFGRDWHSPEELDRILDGAADRRRVWTAPRAAPALAIPASEADAPFARFLAERVDAIPGWLLTESALLTAHLTAEQRKLGLAGPALEIGVFKGRYLSVLYALSQEGEPVVGVDLFIGATDTAAVASEVRANVARACGEAGRLSIVVADSLELTPERLRRELGGAPARFISIDGGHTRELVEHDLAVTWPLLQPGGIMALDDAFNFLTPGVAEGIARFFVGHRPRLAPFAYCYNKLFVTTPDHHARYLASALAFAEAATWLPTHQGTLAYRAECIANHFTPALYGHEVLPFQ